MPLQLRFFAIALQSKVHNAVQYFCIGPHFAPGPERDIKKGVFKRLLFQKFAASSVLGEHRVNYDHFANHEEVGRDAACVGKLIFVDIFCSFSRAGRCSLLSCVCIGVAHCVCIGIFGMIVTEFGKDGSTIIHSCAQTHKRTAHAYPHIPMHTYTHLHTHIHTHTHTFQGTTDCDAGVLTIFVSRSFLFAMIGEQSEYTQGLCMHLSACLAV